MRPGDETRNRAGARRHPRCVLVAVSAMGLGHAQRALAPIRALRAGGSRIVLVAHGEALAMLRQALAGDEAVAWHDLPDYPPLQRGRGLAHYRHFFADLPAVARAIRAERALAARLVHAHAPDCILSDGRFGFRHRAVPSLLICHQLRFLLPPLLRPAQLLGDLAQLALLRGFDRILVPDGPDPAASLAGGLAHNWIARALRAVHVGHLSSAVYKSTAKDIDILFIAGGFLADARADWTAWAERAAAAARAEGAGRIVLVGASAAAAPDGAAGAIERHVRVDGAARDALMNRARLVVGRAGYTTLMDLVELRQDALLIPTAGMTEQAYLARRFPARDFAGRTVHVFRHADLPPAIRDGRSAASVARILDEIGALLDG